MTVLSEIEASIAHASKKIAESETPEEASGWQGIINQQLEAKRQLLEASEAGQDKKLDLKDE